MSELNLRLNLPAENGESDPEANEAKVKDAQARKASANESLEDAWQRILTTSLSDKNRKLVEIGKRASLNGDAKRLSDGKLTQKEAIEIGRRIYEAEEKERRQSRMKETIENKPDNYYVITKDSDLPEMVERIREEVRLQQDDDWFRKVFRLFDDTHIRRKLAEQGIDIPPAQSFTEWDTETSGTDTMIDLSGGYSFWLPMLDEGYYVAYGHLTDDEQCSRSAALQAVKRFIEHPAQIKAFHNTPFDYAMFKNDGLTPRGFRYDSLDAQRNLNENEESKGLKELFTKYKTPIGGGHLDDYTFEDLFGRGSPMIYSPLVVGIYAIKDVEKGWLLTKWQIEMMMKIDDLYKPYFEIRQYLYEVNTTIERTGFVINTDKLAKLDEEYTARLEEAIRKLYEAYGIDEEFLYEMSMHIKGDKINEWVGKQKKRIRKQVEMLDNCEKELKKSNPKTKKYKQLEDRIHKYKTNPLPEAIPQNAPDFVTEFNLASDQHLQYLIYDVLKIDDKTKLFDKKKERTVNKDVMALYYKEEESLKPLDEYSQLSTLLGTFVRKIPLALDSDGRLHTKLETVSTGRYSSKGYTGKPTELWRDDINDDNFLDHMRVLVEAEKKTKKGTNLQNIPARTEEGQKVRMAFEPPPGHTFVGSDLSSIEPRIQAHRMETEFGDSKFAEMYRQGLDPYVEFAAILFDVPTEICTEAHYKSVKGTDKAVPAYRKAMKQMFLAIGYGQAFDMFYKGVIPFGIDEKQARIAYDKFAEILPGFSGMVDATFDHLREHGWTATIFGQKRRFPGYIEKYKRLCTLMKRAGIDGKNDPGLGGKANRLRKKGGADLVGEFWDLMRFTGGCERAAFNHTIQGSGANILQLCMIRAYYEGTVKRGWEFSLTLHDEQKSAVPTDQLTEEVIDLYDDIMKNTYNLVLPLDCDTVIETCWMEEYGRDEWDFERGKPKED